jgi:hypothetical protein
MELIFNLSNLVVMPFWLAMIFAPHWKVTRATLQSWWVIVPPALIYAALVLPALPALAGLASSPSLEMIAAGLGTPEGAATAWAHLVTFDLLAGRWIYLDSREKQLSAWLVSPLLFLTLMLGPLGLLAYLILRSAAKPAQK